MTVSYTGDVANGSHFGCFWKILARWRGSVYKLIWRELVAYLILYYIINIIYRYGLDDTQKTTFEKIKVYCRKNIESIPMSFVLGFYVSLIVKRWWDQYWILPMPDSLALYISASIQGQDERGRLLRRTIMRYTMLSYIICLQRISFRVKKRFPTMQHLVDTGLMTESEMKIYEKMDQKAKVLKFWMPVVWASNLINRARHEGRIQSDHMVQTIVTELSDFRRKLGRIMVFDNVSVPLVYTQVVTLAVYTYFLAALIGRQWVAPRDQELIALVYPGYNLDLYFPIFLSLQFIFYIGWLKVAETLINPFGEDDDDFELNWLIDRHIKVSYMVVDEMHEEHPELLKDQYWEQVVPQDLPYNIASERYRKTEPQGSTASLKVNPNESVYADLSSVKRHSAIPDDVYAEYESVAESPLADGRKTWLQRQLSRVESFRSTSSSSSLFGRNRANSAVNGGLGIGYHGHHRPSLYERLMNRRSSKDARHSNRAIHRPSSNSLSVPEKGFLPNSRPRVPTPDVTKENQINPHLQITAASPPPATKLVGKTPYTNGDGLPTGTTNPGYGSPASVPKNPPGLPPQSTPLYAKKNQNNNNHNYGTSPQKSHYAQQPLPAAPPVATPTNNHVQNNNNNVAPLKVSTTPSPPPYDQTHSANATSAAAMMLSTIAENDASPYSTSSTNHGPPNSAAYPTTTSIFGRKPSPPPFEELPPIPSVTLSSAHSSKNSSLKSEHASRGTPDHSIYIKDLPGNSPMEMLGRVNEGYETDEGDDGRRYMTIAEVNECRAELEKTLVVQPISPPIIQKEPTQRNPSDDLVPLPTLPPTNSIPNTSASSSLTAEIAPFPLRYGPSSIFRQDAVCLPDMGNVPESSSSVQPRDHDPIIFTETSLSNEIITIQHKPSRAEPDEDDGYHERVSYSEDDEVTSNNSDKGREGSPTGNPTRKVSTTHSLLSNASSSTNTNRPTPPPIESNSNSNSSSSNNLQKVDEFSYLNHPKNHGDTLRSNASDSDISHISTFSIDQSSLPVPSRQKPIRRRKTENFVPKNDDDGDPGEGGSGNNLDNKDTYEEGDGGGDDVDKDTNENGEKVARDKTSKGNKKDFEVFV